MLDEQYTQLLQLQDDDNPEFVEEVRCAATACARGRREHGEKGGEHRPRNNRPRGDSAAATFRRPRAPRARAHRRACRCPMPTRMRTARAARAPSRASHVTPFAALPRALAFRCAMRLTRPPSLSCGAPRQVVQLYLDDSVVKLDKLTTALAAETPPVADIDGVVHQFTGSSASLGAARVAAACVSFRTAAKASDVEGMKTWLAAMRAEFTQARGVVLPRCVCRALTASRTRLHAYLIADASRARVSACVAARRAGARHAGGAADARSAAKGCAGSGHARMRVMTWRAGSLAKAAHTRTRCTCTLPYAAGRICWPQGK